MKKRHLLQFKCLACKCPVSFSVFELDSQDSIIPCNHCNRKYGIQDEGLKRQIKKFEALCLQILDSEEILSSIAVGIDVGEHQVKVPYKLLLTRFNSMLDLNIGGQKVSIAFRLEPLTDLPQTVKNKSHSL